MHVVMQTTATEVTPRMVTPHKYAAKLGARVLGRRWIRQVTDDRTVWTTYLEENEMPKPGFYMRKADDEESVEGVEVYEDVTRGWLWNGTRLAVRVVIKFHYVPDVEEYKYDPMKED